MFTVPAAAECWTCPEKCNNALHFAKIKMCSLQTTELDKGANTKIVQHANCEHDKEAFQFKLAGVIRLNLGHFRFAP